MIVVVMVVHTVVGVVGEMWEEWRGRMIHMNDTGLLDGVMYTIAGD